MQDDDYIFSRYVDTLLVDENLRELTVDVYKQVVSDYLKFCKDNACKVDDVKSIERFYISISLSSRTLNKYTSALNSYFQFCQKNSIITTNPIEKLDKIKLEKKMVRAIDEKNILQFIDTCSKDKELGMRDRAMFLTLYYGGLRVSELVNIKLDDMDFSLGSVKVIGKRDKERIVPLTISALNAIEEYIANLRKIHDKKNNQFLFISRRGDRLTRVQVWYRMKKFAPVEIQEKFFPHAFRHSCATKLLESQSGINNIKDILGHASIATTQIYTQVNNDAIKREYFRVFGKLC